MSARTAQATPEEVQTVVAARRLEHARSVFIGVGRPSTAAILARMVHNPELVLVYESGTIGAKPFQVPLSIGDGELAETADAVVSVTEMFNYWIGAGRIEVAFLGAAQIDKHANLNSTVIGDYKAPRTRLPGAGGAPEIAIGCQEVVVIAPHSRRTFVAALDFLTTTAQLTTHVITDLGVLEPRHGELTLTQVHQGVTAEQTRDATGWDLRVADELRTTEPPNHEELAALRELRSRVGAVPPAIELRATRSEPRAKSQQIASQGWTRSRPRSPAGRELNSIPRVSSTARHQQPRATHVA